MIGNVIRGHESFDTAYLIENYPYGRLRCKKKVWLDKNSPNKGVRLAECTENPKTHIWNKVHNSIYANFGVMYLEADTGYCKWYSIMLPWPEHHYNFRATGLHKQLNESELLDYNKVISTAKMLSPKTWHEWAFIEKYLVENKFPTVDELYSAVSKDVQELPDNKYGLFGSPLPRKDFDIVYNALKEEGRI